MARDYPLRLDVPVFKQVSTDLTATMKVVLQTEDLEITWTGRTSRDSLL